MADFNFFENIPLFVLTLAFFVVFVIFLFGGFLLLFAGRNIEKIERGRRVLLNSLYALFTVLLIVLVFFTVTYLLKKGEVLLPQQSLGEFPSSPAANFPPPPQFIKIGEYYFMGLWLLEEYDLIGKSALYAIFCKRNEEYDIMYIGDIEGRKKQIFGIEEYECLMEGCSQGSENFYIAILEIPPEAYNSADRKAIRKELINQLNPSCSPAIE